MSVVSFHDPVVRTEMYDGPLDLLLHLVQRDGIDLRQLPLVHITREYLAALAELEVLDLDLAGEFLVMAATLCELKSRELIPGVYGREDEDEVDDPQEALVRRIIRLQRYRQAAGELERTHWVDRDVFTRPKRRPQPGARPIEPGIDAIELRGLYQRMVARRERPEPVHEVQREPVRWRDTVQFVLVELDDGQERPLDLLLGELPNRPARVLAFLAVLELCRIGALAVHQREHLSPVLLRGMVSSDEADLSHIPEAM